MSNTRPLVIDPRDPKFCLFVERAELMAAVEPFHGGGKVSEPHWNCTVQLIIWDRSNDTVRDIKEQLVCVPEELPALVIEGWSNAVKKVLATAPDVEMMYPRDFLDFNMLVVVSELRKSKTAEDYEKAFLVKSRLGRWLPAVKAA